MAFPTDGQTLASLHLADLFQGKTRFCVSAEEQPSSRGAVWGLVFFTG